MCDLRKKPIPPVKTLLTVCLAVLNLWAAPTVTAAPVEKPSHSRSGSFACAVEFQFFDQKFAEAAEKRARSALRTEAGIFAVFDEVLRTGGDISRKSIESLPVSQFGAVLDPIGIPARLRGKQFIDLLHSDKTLPGYTEILLQYGRSRGIDVAPFIRQFPWTDARAEKFARALARKGIRFNQDSYKLRGHEAEIRQIAMETLGVTASTDSLRTYLNKNSGRFKSAQELQERVIPRTDPNKPVKRVPAVSKPKKRPRKSPSKFVVNEQDTFAILAALRQADIDLSRKSIEAISEAEFIAIMRKAGLPFSFSGSFFTNKVSADRHFRGYTHALLHFGKKTRTDVSRYIRKFPWSDETAEQLALAIHRAGYNFSKTYSNSDDLEKITDISVATLGAKVKLSDLHAYINTRSDGFKSMERFREHIAGRLQVPLHTLQLQNKWSQTDLLQGLKAIDRKFGVLSYSQINALEEQELGPVLRAAGLPETSGSKFIAQINSRFRHGLNEASVAVGVDPNKRRQIGNAPWHLLTVAMKAELKEAESRRLILVGRQTGMESGRDGVERVVIQHDDLEQTVLQRQIRDALMQLRGRLAPEQQKVFDGLIEYLEGTPEFDFNKSVRYIARTQKMSESQVKKLIPEVFAVIRNSADPELLKGLLQ